MPAGSSRAVRLDPLALPVRFAASDAAADERVRWIELDRERVVLRRAVRGIPMAIKVPVNAFLGVALRLVATEGGECVTLSLEHRDPALSVPLFCQGDDSTGQLIRQFAEDETSCLFGTLSLWQGVDVPGPALQLVVIDRIPFPRPDDPLASARQRAVAARGGNGFMSVAAAQAALLLAQGAGRLLRTMTDRGVVAVLDPRLVTARYGDFLRASLFSAEGRPCIARHNVILSFQREKVFSLTNSSRC